VNLNFKQTAILFVAEKGLRNVIAIFMVETVVNLGKIFAEIGKSHAKNSTIV